MMSFFEVKGITKKYGDMKVLDGISISAEQGEFISILGESGSGKTTLLRIIAGLEDKFEGEVFLGGQAISKLPTQKRGVSMVFQDYLLFPHLTAIENIEFGLKIRGIGKGRRSEEASKLLKLVQMEEHKDKYPHQLSGGQKQRIAIARAVIVKPSLLLLDEPFSSLDANLRIDMCDFIRSVQKQTGITTILVTHDREEAMKISNKIALFNKGRITQFDVPSGLYEKPVDMYTAGFMGDINILSEAGGFFRIVRPEDIHISEEGREGAFGVIVKDLQYAGSRTKCKVMHEGREILLFIAGNDDNIEIGSKINIRINQQKILEIKA